jgi:hypothetical protein
MAFLNSELQEHQMAKQATAGTSAQRPHSQLRLNQLDDQGCLSVLRFVLSAFRARRPEDRFWSLLRQFLFDAQVLREPEAVIVKELLSQSSCLDPKQARALLDYLSQAYAQAGDRLFWTTLNDAIQIYSVIPLI